MLTKTTDEIIAERELYRHNHKFTLDQCKAFEKKEWNHKDEVDNQFRLLTMYVDKHIKTQKNNLVRNKNKKSRKIIEDKLQLLHKIKQMIHFAQQGELVIREK